ncbi:MAG: hypothetical protein WC668_01940 [Patescibacteria group bacterium]|jgi:hypothetical protein
MNKFVLTPLWKRLLFSLFLIFAFLSAVGFWYSPVLFKGYSTESIGEGIILARNYVKSGTLGIENDLNVVVASDLAKTSVHNSYISNGFNAISDVAIFKLFGWQSWNNLVLISVVIYALSLVFLAITTYCLFGFPIAVIFSLVYILLPFSGQTARAVSLYEFAQLYLSLFILFFFLGRGKKFYYLYLAIAGVFLSLACLSRETFFIFLPILFIWLVISGKKKELLSLFIPIGLILSFFWLPSMIGPGSGNTYASLFVAQDQNQSQWSEFDSYGHIYPDPYTFHFDRQQVIDQINTDLKNNNSSFLYKIDRLKVGKNSGIIDIGILERLVVGTSILIAHLSKFLAIEFIGGPIIFILICLGLLELKKKNISLYYLFLSWLVGSVVLMSYVVLSSRSHLMDFTWPIAVLSALGLAGLVKSITDHYQFKKYSSLVSLGLIVLTLYSLVVASHVYLGRSYDDNRNLVLDYLAQKINERNIGSTEVIAVGERTAHPILNYLTDKSIVYFDPATIKKMAQTGNLQQAFDKFNVKYVVGFNSSTSDLITQKSQAVNIAVWPETGFLEQPVGFNKMWLLNIIK